MSRTGSLLGAGTAIGLAALVQFSTIGQAAQAPRSSGCLTAEQRATNDKYNALTRPTSRDDEMPFFDPEYFAGTWDFISRAVDSPFGPGGESAGSLTVTSAGGCNYEGQIKGEDPDGKPYTRKVTFAYDTIKKQLVRTEVDSRGYTIVMPGPIGGELGGLFHHHFEDGAPTTIDGKKVSFRGVTEMSSPAFYKTDFQISIDGGPAAPFGRATFEKRIPGAK